MTERIQQLLAEVEAYRFDGPKSLEEFKRLYTGRKGALADLFEQLKTVATDQKATVGKYLNELKKRAEERFTHAQAEAEAGKQDATRPEDPTLPGEGAFTGARHPLAVVQKKVVGIFQRIGFEVAEGPEIEDDWHNFSALNFAPNHPARDMQDTFFVQSAHTNNQDGVLPDHLLRTHTSSVQIRVMEQRKPPLRILMPGRVYRNEAISARAHCFFHQIEGLVVDTDISFADMKQTLLYFVRNLFGPEVQIRLRPSYFPFTEISAEMDVSCRICHGKGCNVCKYNGWLEILGCGMVHPNVLRNCGVDPDVYSGYAWGMGLERMVQLLYRVPDLRLYSQNDLRFLQQFQRIGLG